MSDRKVMDYMTKNVEVLYENCTVREAINQILNSKHYGLPVVSKNNVLQGFLTSKELLRHISSPDLEIIHIIQKGTYTASPDMDIDDAARVIFRWGLRDMPVVDKDNKLVGIISNLDVVRSHFDRATPYKINTIVELLKAKYKINPLKIERKIIHINDLHPTQWVVYQDELEGRMYELERGLAEPLIVIDRKGVLVLVDGHHRVLAARRLGILDLVAFIIYVDMSEPLGMEKTAIEKNVFKIEDIAIENKTHHPLIEVTTKLMKENEN